MLAPLRSPACPHALLIACALAIDLREVEFMPAGATVLADAQVATFLRGATPSESEARARIAIAQTMLARICRPHAAEDVRELAAHLEKMFA